MAEAAAHDLPESAERSADQGDRRYASLFKIDCIDDAPRRRRATMADATDRHVRLGRHFVDERRTLGWKSLPPELDVGDTVAVPERLCQRFQHDVGKLLAIVEKPDAETSEGFWPIGSRNKSGFWCAGRNENSLCSHYESSVANF